MQQDSSHPTGVRDDSPKGNSEVARARNRKANAALQMRLAHATWDEIAEVLGFPTPRAAEVATEQALEKELREEGSKAHMRSMASMRLDKLLRSIWTKAIDPNHPDQLAANGAAAQRIAQWTKLHGLDAPAEVIVSTPAQSELERWVSRVIQAEQPALQEADIFDVVEGSVTEPKESSALPS